MTLRDSSDLVIHRIKIWAVRRPQVGRKKSGITWRSSSTVARVPVHCAAGIQSHYRDTAYRWQQFLSQKHITIVCSVYIFARFNKNKCIGDDTKAAARQSLNCIKNKNKLKHGEKQFSMRRMEFLHPAMWHDHDIDFARWLHPAMWHVVLESWQ